jgi:hypothetical protein
MHHRNFPFQTSYPSTSLETRQVNICLDYDAEVQTGCPINISHTINRGENSDHEGVTNILAVHKESEEMVVAVKIISTINSL